MNGSCVGQLHSVIGIVHKLVLLEENDYMLSVVRRERMVGEPYREMVYVAIRFGY